VAPPRSRAARGGLRISSPIWRAASPEQRKRLVTALLDVQERLDEPGSLRLDIGEPDNARPPGQQTTDDDLEAALNEARARGRRLAAQILAGPEMLSSESFAQRIGVTRETVRRKLSRREVLGLSGAKRGWRFPAWQVLEDGRLLTELSRLFELLDDNPWTVYRFLLQPHPELAGRTALAALRTGEVDAVLGLAESTGHTMT
jgi:hypothetical protein